MKTMKRIAAAVLMLCILAAMLPMAVSAATTSSGTCGTGVNWALDGTTLTISGSGAMKDFGIFSPAPWASELGRIRTLVIEEGVTTIGNYAFSECSSLASVTIPESVWSIGNYAFEGCSALTAITLPDTVYTVGSYVFDRCTGLKSVTLSSGLNAIGTAMFYRCSSLTDITIPEGVKSIGNYAFESCTSLKQITIPDTVTTIGSYAFSAAGLTSIAIPEGVSQINQYTFYDCKSLTSVICPSSLSTIESNGFLMCNKLAVVFCLGTKEVKENLTAGYNNGDFIDAAWHYEVTDVVLGKNAAKHCGECDLYYLLDGTGADYSDVSKTSWQIKSVNYACVRGLMAGKGTDKNGLVVFDPNKPISREEFVQVLYNAEGKPSVSLVNEFLDVQNTWYTKAVLWAKSKDIANGTPDGNFGVGKNITRQDLAMMLYKYAKMKGCDLSLNAGAINRFADGNKVASYAKNAMDWAVTQGVLSGKGTTGSTVFYLDPAGTATRAECAAMLKNFMTAFNL